MNNIHFIVVVNVQHTKEKMKMHTLTNQTNALFPQKGVSNIDSATISLEANISNICL